MILDQDIEPLAIILFFIFTHFTQSSVYCSLGTGHTVRQRAFMSSRRCPEAKDCKTMRYDQRAYTSSRRCPEFKTSVKQSDMASEPLRRQGDVLSPRTI